MREPGVYSFCPIVLGAQGNYSARDLAGSAELVAVHAFYVTLINSEGIKGNFGADRWSVQL